MTELPKKQKDLIGFLSIQKYERYLSNMKIAKRWMNLSDESKEYWLKQDGIPISKSKRKKYIVFCQSNIVRIESHIKSNSQKKSNDTFNSLCGYIYGLPNKFKNSISNLLSISGSIHQNDTDIQHDVAFIPSTKNNNIYNINDKENEMQGKKKWHQNNPNPTLIERKECAKILNTEFHKGHKVRSDQSVANWCRGHKDDKKDKNDKKDERLYGFSPHIENKGIEHHSNAYQHVLREKAIESLQRRADVELDNDHKEYFKEYKYGGYHDISQKVEQQRYSPIKSNDNDNDNDEDNDVVITNIIKKEKNIIEQQQNIEKKDNEYDEGDVICTGAKMGNDDVKYRDIVNVDNYIEAENAGYFVKYCPECRVQANRPQDDESCSMITCKECFTYWCWDCNSIIDESKRKNQREFWCQTCRGRSRAKRNCKKSKYK